ncbi:uncharacterized protein LOC133180077 [Saccostrea echinata]|uniref:uncharacterized protein LOC133180077 n=1 Tax=Saccostrea echinata TaxID=191078 RepID=UPI002A803540|nr:uncharacterized protein LOC133180077 [Saccostrea echinata]
MSSDENVSYLDSEESYRPNGDEQSSDDDSDVPSTSTGRRISKTKSKNSKRRSSSPCVFTSTPKNYSSHRLSRSLPRMPSFESLPQAGQSSSPKFTPGEEAIMQYLKTIENKIDTLQGEMKSLREEGIKEKGKRREEQHLYVPPKIRTAVHDAYKQLVEEDGYAAWQTKLGDVKLKVSSEVNKATTQAVKQFVKGLYHDVQEGILQAAVARYFESMAQKEHKEKTGKVEDHKNKMLHYSRRKRKLQWRKTMVEKKTGWDEAKKLKVSDALELSYMSSEEEHNSDDECFLRTKPLTWRLEEYLKILNELDIKYERTMSKRSRRQMMKSVKGDVPSVRQKPTHVKKEHEWVFAH